MLLYGASSCPLCVPEDRRRGKRTAIWNARHNALPLEHSPSNALTTAIYIVDQSRIP